MVRPTWLIYRRRAALPSGSTRQGPPSLRAEGPSLLSSLVCGRRPRARPWAAPLSFPPSRSPGSPSAYSTPLRSVRPGAAVGPHATARSRTATRARGSSGLPLCSPSLTPPQGRSPCLYRFPARGLPTFHVAGQALRLRGRKVFELGLGHIDLGLLPRLRL